MKSHNFLICCIVIGLFLGIKDGNIALWKDETPVKIYPYRAEFLPEADQNLLKSGIPIQNDADLAEFLEDYLS